MGAILAGSEERIEEAWHLKFLFGGALRQAGVVAAAMLYALDHNVERLAEDHARARRLARGSRRRRACRSTSTAWRRTSSASTSPPSASTRTRRRPASRSRACCVGFLRPGVLRVATHLGVTDDDVDRAIELIPRGAGRPCSSLTRSRGSSAPGRPSTASRASPQPSTAAARSSGARRSASPTRTAPTRRPTRSTASARSRRPSPPPSIMLLRDEGKLDLDDPLVRARPRGAPRRPDDPPPARPQLRAPARAARRGLGDARVPARAGAARPPRGRRARARPRASTSTTRTSPTRCSARSSRAPRARRFPISSTSG